MTLLFCICRGLLAYTTVSFNSPVKTVIGMDMGQIQYKSKLNLLFTNKVCTLCNTDGPRTNCAMDIPWMVSIQFV